MFCNEILKTPADKINQRYSDNKKISIEKLDL